MSNLNLNICLMAFSKGNESTDAIEIKRYIGIAPCKVLAVNPNKAELEKIYGVTLEKEPEYVSVTQDDSGKQTHNVRLDFIIKTDADKCGVDLISKLTFFMKKAPRYNRDNTKCQIIDKYGRTAWASVEDAKNHVIPQYANGSANIDAGYRPAYNGEEDLINFLKTFLCIPNVMKYNRDTKVWSMVENPEECEAALEKIVNYFNNDFKELRDIISLQPENRVKVLFGVRSTDDNKLYQTTYTTTVRNSASDFSKLKQEILDRKANGALTASEFFVGGEIVPIQEYSVTPTNYSGNANTAETSTPTWFE